MNKVIRILGLSLFGLFVLTSCGGRQGLGALDLAHTYQKDGALLHPVIRVYHQDLQTSTVYFSFSSEELLYVRPSSREPFRAEARIQVLVYETMDPASAVDTGFTVIRDTQSILTPHALQGSVDITIDDSRPLSTYVMFLRINDVNRQLHFDEMRLIERSNPTDRQNYILTKPDGEVVYTDHVQLNETYKVRFNDSSYDSLKVNFYQREFDWALPPFVEGEGARFNYRPDSAYYIPNGGEITPFAKGFYHIQSDTELRDGFTLYHYDENFPRITKKEQMAGPLRFLTTNLEFEGIELNNPDSAKIEVDKFWLRHAGSEERARNQVEEYYKRVQAANTYFTSYHEGWKTDRGILYTVYGPPTKIYRTVDTETWVYGEENSSLNYTFVFDRMINPFTPNDYTLRRKPEYRRGWGIAVDAWRHGRIYDSTDIKRAQDERDQQLRQTAPPHIWY